MRRIALLAVATLAFVAAPVPAQTVQRCHGADGAVEFTSGACPDGSRLAATYTAVPDVGRGAGAAATAEATGRRASEPRSHAGAGSARRGSARAGAQRGTARQRGEGSAACRDARAKRERTLERVGLTRTYDLLRALDDAVWVACR
jgi:hypothetical protein